MTGVTAAELGEHPFLRGLPDRHLAVLSRACWVSPVRAGARLFAEGDPAHRFWLVRSGHIAVDVHSPGRPPLIVETLGEGDLLGLSWLVPPYEWKFGAMAVQSTLTYELDAPVVRSACEADPGLGYELLRRVMSAASSRLHATRVRMLDLYAAPGAVAHGR